jgi:hypothetical protein
MKIPKESLYDEEGTVVEFGDRFYAPAPELLILLPNSEEWVKGNDLPVIEIEEPSLAYSDLGEDFIPVSDNDITGFPYGRVS